MRIGFSPLYQHPARVMPFSSVQARPGRGVQEISDSKPVAKEKQHIGPLTVGADLRARAQTRSGGRNSEFVQRPAGTPAGPNGNPKLVPYPFVPTYLTIFLKASVCCLMPTSAANRSMLEAPKKPSMPRVRLITYSASSGSAIGPP